MTGFVTEEQIAKKFPGANLSALPTSNPGGGKPWLSGGAVVVGNYAGNTVDWSAIANKPTEFTPTAHTHDDRYYTKSQIDAGYAKLSGGNSFSGNQVVSGTIDASATLTGHRLGYLGFIDSVTLGWPGTSFGGFQSGSSGVLSFALRSAGISSLATGVISIGNGTYGDQTAQVRAGAFRAQGGNGVVGTLWVNNSNDTWSAFQFPASQNALTFSPGVAGLFRFEGTTSAHPALKRSGTTIQARLADDSADAPISSAGVTASGMIVANGGIDMGSSAVYRRTSFFVWRNTAVGKHAFRNWVETSGVTLDYSTDGLLNLRNRDDSGAGNLTCGLVTSAFRSLSANPTTLDIAAGQEQLVLNTTTNELRRWANVSGTMRSVLYA